MPSASERRDRLAAELKVLQDLRDSSTIFDFTHNDSPPDRYQLIFKGKGYRRASASSRRKLETLDKHQVEMRLPYSYPERPPDVRWVSPIFHPNISSTGYLQLEDVGLDWHPEMTLVVLCEKLWDLARFAHFDLEKTSNFQAERYWEQVGDEAPPLPADQRVLRNRGVAAQSNIIKYNARGLRSSGKVEFQGPATASDDVLYIGEDTPQPPLTRRSRPIRRERGGDDDILYIGDD